MPNRDYYKDFFEKSIYKERSFFIEKYIKEYSSPSSMIKQIKQLEETHNDLVNTIVKRIINDSKATTRARLLAKEYKEANNLEMERVYTDIFSRHFERKETAKEILELMGYSSLDIVKMMVKIQQGESQ